MVAVGLKKNCWCCSASCQGQCELEHKFYWFCEKFSKHLQK